MTMASPRQQIAAIDKQIDANRAALQRLETFDQYDAGSWQAAWDRQPDLRDRETTLFQQRALLQIARDTADAKLRTAATRADRLRKCPACGLNTLRAA